MDTACTIALSLKMDTRIMIAAQQKQSLYRYYTAYTKHLRLLHSIDKAIAIAAQHEQVAAQH